MREKKLHMPKWFLLYREKESAGYKFEVFDYKPDLRKKMRELDLKDAKNFKILKGKEKLPELEMVI